MTLEFGYLVAEFTCNIFVCHCKSSGCRTWTQIFRIGGVLDYQTVPLGLRWQEMGRTQVFLIFSFQYVTDFCLVTDSHCGTWSSPVCVIFLCAPTMLVHEIISKVACSWWSLIVCLLGTIFLHRTHSVAVYASAHWLKVCSLKVMDTLTVKVLINICVMPFSHPLDTFTTAHLPITQQKFDLSNFTKSGNSQRTRTLQFWQQWVLERNSRRRYIYCLPGTPALDGCGCGQHFPCYKFESLLYSR